MAKIYTKVGDKGMTGLLGGSRVSKSDPHIWSYGTVDELNSCLGFARAEIDAQTKKTAATASSVTDRLARLNADFETIQHWLFDLGSLLAALPADREKFALPQITQDHITWLEGKIDDAMNEVEPLKVFILPAGSELAARIHIARTTCRRAERLIVDLEDAPAFAVPFVNRLSDYLFTMARYANHLLGVKDVPWVKTAPQT